MASLHNFDSEIEKTRTMVNEMRTKIDQSTVVLDKFAKADEKIGASDFDIENARIDDVLRQQKVMEGNIAELIIGLEDATNVFGSEFESMKGYSGWEKFVGVFSKQKDAAPAFRPRAQYVACRESSGTSLQIRPHCRYSERTESCSRRTLQNLRDEPCDCHRTPQDRRSPISKPHRSVLRNSTLSCSILKTSIAASTDQGARTELEGQRSKLATEYNERQAKEQELLAESQTLERYTSMFQTFVDSLNNQIAAQSTLINKLAIDTEQRIVLYKALEDSLKTAAQQDVAHKINTLGSKVDTAAEETMAGVGAAAQKHIGDLLEMHEKNMVSSQDIQRRKKLADDAFSRRFSEVLKKHNSADYVKS